MAKVTIWFGLLLAALGAAGWLESSRASWTALIPSLFGGALLALGLAAGIAADHARKHLMHVAVMVGLVGALLTISSLVDGVRYLSGGAVERLRALPYRVAMCLLCALFVALCVRSFIQARRKRAAGA
ncbi:MAG: hypothetical protein U1A27_12760 [Phycisphaerae bacterium]